MLGPQPYDHQAVENNETGTKAGIPITGSGARPRFFRRPKGLGIV